MPLNLGFILVALVATSLVTGACAQLDLLDDVSPDEAEAFYLCINTIVCDLRMAVEVKRIGNSAGPLLYQTGLGWLSDCFNLEMEMDDLTTFWKTYSDKVCNQSDEVRRDCTKEMAMNYVNFYEANCEENPDPSECTKAEKTVVVVSEIIADYTKSGDCNKPEDVAESAAKEAEGKFAGEAQKMAPKMPSPGFG